MDGRAHATQMTAFAFQMLRNKSASGPLVFTAREASEAHRIARRNFRVGDTKLTWLRG